MAKKEHDESCCSKTTLDSFPLFNNQRKGRKQTKAPLIVYKILKIDAYCMASNNVFMELKYLFCSLVNYFCRLGLCSIPYQKQTEIQTWASHHTGNKQVILPNFVYEKQEIKLDRCEPVPIVSRRPPFVIEHANSKRNSFMCCMAVSFICKKKYGIH